MTRGALAWIVLVAGCGRIGFDPSGSGTGSGSGSNLDDADPARDGDPVDGDGAPPPGDALPDGPQSVCETATLVGIGRTPAIDTCSRGDRIDGCGPAGTSELVFKFIAPANNGYNFRAYNAGTTTITSSTARLDAPCAATTGACAGILSFPMTGGQVVYLVVEPNSAACIAIEFDIEAT